MTDSPDEVEPDFTGLVNAWPIVLFHLAFVGTAPQADEGTEAHLWQLLMAGQVPIVASFVFTELARDSGSRVRVLGMQLIAALAALVPVYLLHW